ncbi:hypothetical protein MNVI_22510 [Mycobacterium noviomagense]|uniref:Uncharacterized protein n=1 Tax=Mycobacterium noviomagense TaxID=459858 RepID=A0A7I7PE97_9MYCO|nr:hypothetical protein MNVI_22510 [Mycobacterium noviomagense]
MVAARIGDDGEQLAGRRGDLDRAAYLLRSGVDCGDGHGLRLVLGMALLIPSFKTRLQLHQAKARYREPYRQAGHQ